MPFPSHHKLLQLALATALTTSLAACGGGDSAPTDPGDMPPAPAPAPAPVSSDPIRSIDFEGAPVAASSSFTASDAAFCNASSKAYGGTNTITYAESGVSDANHQAVARYAEAAARYIKSKLELDQAGKGFGDDIVIAVCAQNGGAKEGNGSGFYSSLEVNANYANDDIPYDQPGDGLKRLVLHELIHVAQARLARCTSDAPAYGITAKWFSEGSALLLAGQDQYYTGDLADYRKMAPDNPYDWIANGYPVFERYPIYRLAVESLVLENGFQVDDVWKFTKDHFAQNNRCDANGYLGFNQAISSYFGVDLKNGAWVQSFWSSTLNKYALEE